MLGEIIEDLLDHCAQVRGVIRFGMPAAPYWMIPELPELCGFLIAPFSALCATCTAFLEGRVMEKLL